MMAGRHANHVRVADLPPLHGCDDGHARPELSLHGLDAQDPRVGALERLEHFPRRRRQRTRRDLLDQHGVGGGAGIIERGRQARGDLAAGLVGDERDALARLDGQADADGIVRAGGELG
jgi:hypothetical protein